MNPIRNAMKIAFSRVHVSLSKQIGESATFKHLNGDSATIYGIPQTNADEYGNYGRMKAEDATGIFETAIQSGFDGTFNVGDMIEVLGTTYRITKSENDDLGAVYKLSISKKTAKVA